MNSTRTQKVDAEVWAIVCKSGDVHVDDETALLFPKKEPMVNLREIAVKFLNEALVAVKGGKPIVASMSCEFALQALKGWNRVLCGKDEENLGNRA